MKVLQVNKLYAPWIGGVEKWVQEMAEGMKDIADVDMEVLACQPRGRGRNELINGVRVTKAGSIGISYGMPLSFSFPTLLRKKMKEADIIHFHSPFPLGELSLLLFASEHKRLVVTYHSDIVRQKFLLKLYAPFLRKFLFRADKILVTSSQLLESSPFLQTVRGKCEIVPLGIGIAEFDSRKATRVEFPNPENKKIVLFAGRLVYYKGLEYLIRAMQDVHALLLVVGEGPLRKNLEDQVKELNVTNKVVFLGRLSDEQLKYCYAICTVFVLPSVEKAEAFGLVQLEAMLAAKPVVNTNLPTGVPFVSIHGETGITVPPRDPYALSKAINTLLLDSALAARFGNNGKQRVYERFSQESIVMRILSVYREVAKEKSFIG